MKDEWIAALKAANVTYNSPRRSSKKGGDGEIAGVGSDGDEVFCTFNGRKGKGEGEKDCQCIIS